MFYLFIISSLNLPIYRKVHEKRRVLLRKYGIPYTVLMNHPESSLNEMEVPTLVPMLDDEVLYNGEGYNPFMAQKFLFAVKMYFRSFRTFDEVPNFIVRTNATTYIHYPALIALLESPDFPKTRVLAGPHWGGIFVQGMIMIFSKDVLANMLQDPGMYDKSIMKDNDDVSLSVLSKPYCDWHYISDHLIMPDHTNTDNGIYKLDEIKPNENNKWIFRIVDYVDRNKIDIMNWDNLACYFKEDLTPTPTPSTSSPKTISSTSKTKSSSIHRVFFFIIIILSILLFLFLFYYCIHVFSTPTPKN